MHLNHLNLSVTDVAAASTFFETYFDFKCIARKGNDIIAILIGVDGFELVLMMASMNQKGNSSYPDAFHIGFMMDTTEQVTCIYQKLKAGGIGVERSPAKIRDSYGFYFHFNDLMIEVGAKVNCSN